MNENIKAQWLKELRDPGAVQAKGTLNDGEGGRCCLGVLCDIAVEAGIVRAATKENGYSYNGSTDTLPPEVQEWAGLYDLQNSANPFVTSPVETDNGYEKGAKVVVAIVNDHTDIGFAGIADIIEEQL